MAAFASGLAAPFVAGLYPEKNSCQLASTEFGSAR